MPMRLEGSCRCGEVRFALASHTPQPYQLCYCSICRKTAGGGGYAINLAGVANTLEVLGRDSLCIYRAELEAMEFAAAAVALADLERARAAVATRPRVALELTDAIGCQLVLDGAATAATASVLIGNHWLRVSCPGAAPWGMRLAVSAATSTVAVAARRMLAPGDDELLVVARGAGAREFITVVARGELVWVRRIGGDGRERERRTVALGDGGAVIAAAVDALMRPARPRAPWYRTRWAWAAGVAGATAAIAIPLTLIIAGSDAPTTATVIGPGSRL